MKVVHEGTVEVPYQLIQWRTGPDEDQLRYEWYVRAGLRSDQWFESSGAALQDLRLTLG